MSLKFACVGCGKPGIMICQDCKSKGNVSVNPVVVPVIDDVDVPVVAPVSKSVNKVVDRPAGRSVGDLPVYSASDLNNRMGYDYNSVIHEKCCVKVKGGYVLNKDIIQWYRSRLGA